MSKELAYEDEDIAFYTEIVDGRMAIHCDVGKYDRRVLRRLAIAFSDIKHKAAEDGYREIWAVSKNHKFCLMGGGRLASYYYQREVEYGVYVWETM